jgi:SAM-dependent methyltransferase
MREVFDITVPWISTIPARPVACLLCRERRIHPLNTFILNGARFYTVRCLSDGMMWLDPQPTPEFYHRLYAEHYHLASQDDPLLEQATLDVHTDVERLQQTARLRLDEIQAFAAPGRFLEVGFGSGHTLMEAKARGWDVLGLEVAPSCVDDMRARGIPATRASLAEYDGPGDAFDVVAMYSVIEHVHDPATYLRQAFRLLKPRGILVLRLPDTPDEGPPASLLAHLYHFNQVTISEFLRRHRFEVLCFRSFAIWKPNKYPGELPSMNVISRKA